MTRTTRKIQKAIEVRVEIVDGGGTLGQLNKYLDAGWTLSCDPVAVMGYATALFVIECEQEKMEDGTWEMVKK